jgi:hypothetical protein
MRHTSLFVFLGFTIGGFILLSFRPHISGPYEIYTDRHGDQYLIPTTTWIQIAIAWCLEQIPRFTKKFELIDPGFDLENLDYLESSLMYILLCGSIGLLFLVIIVLFFILRYCFGCCGGKTLPRSGYSHASIAGIRITLVILSFLLEGILLYGYFANSDFHDGCKKLLNVFLGVGEQLQADLDIIRGNLPPSPSGQVVFDEFHDLMVADLTFSTRWAVSQTQIMESTVWSFESWRMAAVLLNLILSTISCSVGIAAGSVSRGVPVMIMIILNSIACVFVFFSAGTHFAGSKILVEYCDEIEYYLEPQNTEIIPNRLQYFLPCVASPVFPYIQDYYIINTVSKCNHLFQLLEESELWDDPSNPIRFSPPHFWNVSSPFYRAEVEAIKEGDLKKEATETLGSAISWAEIFAVLDRNQQCKPSKDAMAGENFLFCSYLRDNLDMLTLTQVIGAVLIVVITIVGIPALKKFEWAGNAGLSGVFNGQRKVNLNKARAKRAI